jgi:hypothetical protein
LWRLALECGAPDRVSSDGAREQPVTRLLGRRGWLGQNIANDDRYVYFTWREDVADIWMMDIVRQ